MEPNSIYRRVGIMTLGCKVNQYESTAIAEEFERHGFTIGRFSEKCGIYVINTCTVTAESDRKARQMIRRAARHNPKAYVLVTGCYSQLNPLQTAEIDGVDFVCGNGNKLRLVDAAIGLIASGEKNTVADIKVGSVDDVPFEKMKIHSSERTRAYIKIEDGCDSKCAYCTVPAARGCVRSKAPEEVIREVEGLVAAGYGEVILTGIKTDAYGRDFEDQYDLADLLREVDHVKGVKRIRLGSIDPALLTHEFIDKLSSLYHLCPSFHISLQSGSTKTLNAMKRRYNAETAAERLLLLREKMPGVTFTADVIVGFPGETEEDFLETVEFVKKIGFLHLHIFPYSRRAGTLAATMDGQIPEEIKNERLARLEAIQNEQMMAKVESYLGRQKEVLFELCENGRAVGHTPDFLEVAVITHEDLHKQIRTVKLNGFDGKTFTGFLI